MTIDRVNSGVTGRKAGTATNGGVDFHNKRIQASLSTQIVINVVGADGNEYPLGAVQTMDVTETREMRELVEVGTDAIIGIVPVSATKYAITIDRIVFDFQRLPQAMQREYRHIFSQRTPFSINILDYNPYILPGSKVPVGAPSPSDLDAPIAQGSSFKTVFYNCWFERLGYSYKAGDYTITENCSIKCEGVYDTEAPGLISVADDALEKDSGTSKTASIMSAYDRT